MSASSRSLPITPVPPVEVEGTQPVRGRTAVTPIEWVALAAGLLPLGVACVWALVESWVPIGDSGQLVVRSRDVFTANHPFVGAWSSSSAVLSSNLNNLGSLYSILLAPFTRVEPYGGAAVGMTVINGACVVGVWAAARSVFGRAGAIGAMLGTLALIASMGTLSLLHTRQQLALLMPFWCLLWVAVALWRGRAWALPAVVFLVSLVVQTHFTFVYQSAAVALAGTLAFVVGQRHRFGDPRFRRPLYVACVVGALCWVQPLWDQLFRQGNLANVFGQSGDNSGLQPGWRVGAQVISHSGLRPPFWLPGSMGRYDKDPILLESSTTKAWLAIGLWLGVALALWLWARSTQRAGIAALAGVAGVALGSGLFAGSQIPPVLMVYAGQNYYWMWPVAILLTMVPAAALASVVLRRPANRQTSRTFTGMAVAGLVLAAIVGSSITSHIDYLSRESFDLRPAARSFVNQVSAGLDAHPIDGPVLIDYSGDFALSLHRYTFLAELQRRHVPFVFDGTNEDVFRFGGRRCAVRSVGQRLLFRSGSPVAVNPGRGAVLLARIDASRKQYEARSRLDAEVRQKLRAGDITVDLDALRELNPSASADVERFRNNSTQPMPRLPEALRQAEARGAVRVPADLKGLMRRWWLATDRVQGSRAALYLQPGPTGPPSNRCP